MGTLSWSLVEEGSKMKLVAAACLVAAVFAEPEAKADADAALLYGGYGYTGLGYAGLGYAGLGYAGLGYAGYGYLPTPHTPMDTTLARGLLMLSPRPRLIPLFSMVPMDTLVLAMLDMLVVLDTVLMLDTHTLEDMLDMDMVDMPGANK